MNQKQSSKTKKQFQVALDNLLAVDLDKVIADLENNLVLLNGDIKNREANQHLILSLSDLENVINDIETIAASKTELIFDDDITKESAKKLVELAVMLKFISIDYDTDKEKNEVSEKDKYIASIFAKNIDVFNNPSILSGALPLMKNKMSFFELVAKVREVKKILVTNHVATLEKMGEILFLLKDITSSKDEVAFKKKLLLDNDILYKEVATYVIQSHSDMIKNGELQAGDVNQKMLHFMLSHHEVRNKIIGHFFKTSDVYDGVNEFEEYNGAEGKSCLRFGYSSASFQSFVKTLDKYIEIVSENDYFSKYLDSYNEGFASTDSKLNREQSDLISNVYGPFEMPEGIAKKAQKLYDYVYGIELGWTYSLSQQKKTLEQLTPYLISNVLTNVIAYASPLKKSNVQFDLSAIREKAKKLSFNSSKEQAKEINDLVDFFVKNGVDIKNAIFAQNRESTRLLWRHFIDTIDYRNGQNLLPFNYLENRHIANHLYENNIMTSYNEAIASFCDLQKNKVGFFGCIKGGNRLGTIKYLFDKATEEIKHSSKCTGHNAENIFSSVLLFAYHLPAIIYFNKNAFDTKDNTIAIARKFGEDIATTTQNKEAEQAIVLFQYMQEKLKTVDVNAISQSLNSSVLVETLTTLLKQTPPFKVETVNAYGKIKDIDLSFHMTENNMLGNYDSFFYKRAIFNLVFSKEILLKEENKKALIKGVNDEGENILHLIFKTPDLISSEAGFLPSIEFGKMPLASELSSAYSVNSYKNEQSHLFELISKIDDKTFNELMQQKNKRGLTPFEQMCMLAEAIKTETGFLVLNDNMLSIIKRAVDNNVLNLNADVGVYKNLIIPDRFKSVHGQQKKTELVKCKAINVLNYLYRNSKAVDTMLEHVNEAIKEKQKWQNGKHSEFKSLLIKLVNDNKKSDYDQVNIASFDNAYEQSLDLPPKIENIIRSKAINKKVIAKLPSF